MSATPISSKPEAADIGTAVLASSSTPHRTAVLWPHPERQAAFEAWIAPLATQYGLHINSLRPASADASFRRYLRIDQAPGTTMIVMDAPPDKENCQPFVHVQALMAQAGLQVPHILAWDEAGGFMLLTDLGHQTVIEQLDPSQPQAAFAWYMQAVDVLLDWQSASKPGVLPVYDEAMLRRELALFPDWYVAQHRKTPLSAQHQATISAAFDAIVRNNLAAPSVFVHRDFMMRNLMAPNTTESKSSGARLGVLDFQDAVYGPITYDIASLLRDAFISWEEDFVIDITVRYWEKARKIGLLGANSASGWGADFGEFYRAVEWMGLQRHLKVAGIFARLTLRDGKTKYLADAPRFIHYIRTTASRYRQLGPFLQCIDHIEDIQEPTGYAFGRV